VDNPEASEQERVIWSAHPSQIVNFGLYGACVLVCLLVIPALYFARNGAPYIRICLGVILGLAVLVFLMQWIKTRSRLYQVTTERIKVIEGMFNRKTEEIELYRVRDYKLSEPFWYRVFGLGNITVSTMDVSTPNIELRAIHDPNGRREELRKFVELCRDKKRVRVSEFET
jgi:uncharacterized membrane protein YdbT with pleckstrin-like domain